MSVMWVWKKVSKKETRKWKFEDVWVCKWELACVEKETNDEDETGGQRERERKWMRDGWRSELSLTFPAAPVLILVSSTQQCELGRDSNPWHLRPVIWAAPDTKAASGCWFSRFLSRRADPWGSHVWCVGGWTVSLLRRSNPQNCCLKHRNPTETIMWNESRLDHSTHINTLFLC